MKNDFVFYSAFVHSISCVLDTHPLDSGCFVFFNGDPEEEAQVVAVNHKGEPVEYSTAYARGWQLLDLRWYNYWQKNLADVRTNRKMCEILKQEMLMIRTLIPHTSALAFRPSRTPKSSTAWQLQSSLKRLERAAMQFEGQNFAPSKLDLKFVLGDPYKCPDFLSAAEFERKVSVYTKEAKAREKINALAMFAPTPESTFVAKPWQKGSKKPTKPWIGRGKKPGGKAASKSKGPGCWTCGKMCHQAAQCKMKPKPEAQKK